MNDFIFNGHRLAFIDKVNEDGTYDIYYAGDVNNVIPSVQAISLGSFSSGVICRFHVGAPVWCGQGYHYQPVIVGYADYALDIEKGKVLAANEIQRPLPKPGEIAIQAESGASLFISETGDVHMSNLNDDGIFISDTHRSIVYNSYQKYEFNDASMTVEGAVKRLHPNIKLGQTPVMLDLLEHPEADAFVVDVCRDPTRLPASVTKDRGPSKVVRNPPFAEKRELIYEFANSYAVRSVDIETSLVTQYSRTLDELNGNVPMQRGYGKDESTNFDDVRHATRTNLLKLDNNVIVERVQGTLVDIFGNVLDLNYNKIGLPTITNDGNQGAVSKAHALLSRSVAYHFQVNTRAPESTGTGKFTFDIDKEGQFRMNVPRSTSAGNVASIIKISDTVDTDNRIDINTISGSASEIASPVNENLNLGTAFHDMLLTADRLIKNTITQINTIHTHATNSELLTHGDFPSTENTDSTPPDFTTTVHVEEGASAITDEVDSSKIGGRSGLVNLEGSLELSIGADIIDSKSLMLDTAGSVIAWLGRDTNGRSAVVNTDGAVLLNIGDYIMENGEKVFNQGSLMIRVNLVDADNVDTSIAKNSDHVLHFTPQGIVISSGGGTPMVFRSSGRMIFEADADMDFKAKAITVDAGTARKISNRGGVI